MAQQANLMQDGVDRINETLKSIDGEIQRVQKDLKGRRRSIEKRIEKSRKSIEKQSRKEVNRLRAEFRKNPIVKRAEAARKDVTKQVESTIDNLLGVFQIASKADMSRIDKKLNALSRRLKEIESAKKSRATHAPTPQASSPQS